MKLTAIRAIQLSANKTIRPGEAFTVSEELAARYMHQGDARQAVDAKKAAPPAPASPTA